MFDQSHVACRKTQRNHCNRNNKHHLFLFLLRCVQKATYTTDVLYTNTKQEEERHGLNDMYLSNA